MKAKRIQQNPGEDDVAAGRRFVEGLSRSVERDTRAIESAWQSVGYTPSERFGWLVRLAQNRPSSGYAKMALSGRKQIAREAYAFVVAQQGSAQRPQFDDAKELAAFIVKLDFFVDDLNQAFADIVRGATGTLRFADASGMTRQLTARRPGRPLLSRYFGPLIDVFILSAADLVAAEGGRLITCARCGRVGASLQSRGRRRLYCSGRCAVLDRTARFRERQPKAEKSERRHEVYVRKVARDLGISEQRAHRLVKRRSTSTTEVQS